MLKTPPRDGATAQADLLEDDQQTRFGAYVQDPTFPCVAARSALNRGRMVFGHYQALGDPASAQALCNDLAAFSKTHQDPGPAPVSFVAMFDQAVVDEAAFTHGLWQHLQALHDVDGARHGWDPAVSPDPASELFSFSVAGRAFFVVGLSPVASRWARRAPFPCLVFNFHDQFEALKAGGQYAGMQRVIRQRDVALQGSVNQTITNFGDASEARQYAGNATPADGVCPFKPAGLAQAG